MTRQLDLSPDLEARLQVLAAQRGTDADAAALQLVAEGLRGIEVPTVAEAPSAWPELDELIRFAASLPDHRAEAGLGPLDLSGPRTDVYGYTEREDAQL